MKQSLSLKTYVSVLTTALAISASALLVVDSTIAQPASHGVRMDPAQADKMIEKRVDHIVKAVSATPEQKTKLLAIAKAAQADIKPIRDQMHTRFDKAIADSREVLTPEQRAKWDEKMKSHRGRMREHMQERMANRPEKK